MLSRLTGSSLLLFEQRAQLVKTYDTGCLVRGNRAFFPMLTGILERPSVRSASKIRNTCRYSVSSFLFSFLFSLFCRLEIIEHQRFPDVNGTKTPCYWDKIPVILGQNPRGAGTKTPSNNGTSCKGLSHFARA